MSTESVRLLASTGPLLLSPLEWIMQAIADAGFDAAEVVIGHDSDTRDPQRVLEIAGATGLDVPVMHGPYMLLLRPVFGMGYADKTRRSLELASEVGADLLVAHAPFGFEFGARKWLEREAPEEFDGFTARFGMENLFPVMGRNVSTAVEPADLVAHRHVVFDTSHFAVAGVDLFAAWDLLQDRVAHLHISDNMGQGRDSHAPVGAGVLPLDRFLPHVVRSGWTGTATLELDVREHLEDRSTLVRFLARQRRIVTGLLAGEPVDGRTDDPDTPVRDVASRTVGDDLDAPPSTTAGLR
jgi:sugar phosphate isomerase/epimerase